MKSPKSTSSVEKVWVIQKQTDKTIYRGPWMGACMDLTWSPGTWWGWPGCWCTCVRPRRCGPARWLWWAARAGGCPASPEERPASGSETGETCSSLPAGTRTGKPSEPRACASEWMNEWVCARAYVRERVCVCLLFILDEVRLHVFFIHKDSLGAEWKCLLAMRRHGRELFASGEGGGVKMGGEGEEREREKHRSVLLLLFN